MNIKTRDRTWEIQSSFTEGQDLHPPMACGCEERTEIHDGTAGCRCLNHWLCIPVVGQQVSQVLGCSRRFGRLRGRRLNWTLSLWIYTPVLRTSRKAPSSGRKQQTTEWVRKSRGSLAWPLPVVHERQHAHRRTKCHVWASTEWSKHLGDTQDLSTQQEWI